MKKHPKIDEFMIIVPIFIKLSERFVLITDSDNRLIIQNQINKLQERLCELLK